MLEESHAEIFEKLKADVHHIAVHSGNLIVGDTVMLNPLMRSLRDSFPLASCDYIGFIQPFVMNFARRVLLFDNYVKLELKKDLFSAVGEFFTSIPVLKKNGYDLIVDNQFVMANSLLLKLSRKRWLLSQCSNGFFSDFPVPGKKDLPRHIIDKSVAPLRHIGLPNVYHEPYIRIDESERIRITQLFSENGISSDSRVLGFAPYSGHEIKNWPVEHYRNLMKIFLANGYKNIIAFVSPGQLVRCKNDFIGFSGQLRFSIELLPESEDLNQVVPLIERMNLIIANDSGLAHVAAALDVPTIVIFGPTSPEKFAPRGNSVKIISSSSQCSPCDIYKRCQNGMKCLKYISPDYVYIESEKLLCEK